MQTPPINNGNHGNPPVDLDRLPNQSETTVTPINYTGSMVAPSPYFPHEMKEEEAGFDIRDFLRRVQRRKWLILTIVTIATVMAAVNSSRQKSIYLATATIELGTDQNQMLIKDGNWFYRDENQEMETAVFLIQSYPLLEDVAANLGLEQNKKFLDVTEERSLSEVLKSKEKINESSAGDALNPPLPVSMDISLEQRSPEESKRLAPLVGILSGGLSVEKVKLTRLVRVSFKHTDPEIATMVANGVAQIFTKRSFKRKNASNEESSTSLNKATRELEAQMQKADQALADYTRNNGIFSLEGKEDLTTNKLVGLHEQTMRAETDRIIKQSLYEDVRLGHVANLPEALSNQQTLDLQRKLSELNIAYAQLNVKYGPDNPKVAEVRDQMTALQKEIVSTRNQLSDKLKADYDRAVRDEASMKSALARAKGEAVQQNQTAIQFNILKQKAETAKTLYTDFLQKTRQMDLETARQTADVTVAEPARVPGGPIGPSRTRSVLLAFLLSLGASIGLVFLLDHLDNTIKTVDDVSRYVRLPALGVIPSIGAQGRRLSLGSKQEKTASASVGILSPKDAYKSAGSIAEAYRMLRTSILLSAAGQPPKTILVTSSQPGEGKTTTTINTSICLSQLGATVLLIDADMRRPRVHKIFGIDHRKGLSNYLSSDISLKTVVQATKTPNLYVMPSGIVPPNSADLLSSEKFRLMLQKLSQHFDHILIDSPPINSVTDPVIISRQVDGVMLIVHGGKSSREMVVHSRQELANVGAKIFGVVLNNVNLNRDGYDYYYRRYQYEYVRESNQLS